MEMNADEVIGRDVISIAEGERLGVISRIFAHRGDKSIAGFGINPGSSWREPDRAYHVDANQIVSLGPDVLMVPHRSALGGKEMDESIHDLLELAQLRHRRVMTEDGNAIGQVERISFDAVTLKLCALTLSTGRGRPPRLIPVDQIGTLGTDVVVAHDRDDEAAVPSDTSSAQAADVKTMESMKGALMNHTHLNGIAVISIADGEKLGSVTAVYIDLEARRIARLEVGQSGGLLSTPQARWTLDAADIHAIGSDAVTVQERTVLREMGEEVETLPENLTTINALTGRKVVTEGGTYVGTVASLEFNEADCMMTAVEVSPGFFKSNRKVPVDHVINPGQEIVVVSDEVVATPEPQTEFLEDRRFDTEESSEPTADRDIETVSSERTYDMVVEDVEEPTTTRSDTKQHG